MKRIISTICVLLAALTVCAALAGCQGAGEKDTVVVSGLTSSMKDASAFPEMLEIKSGDSSAEKGFAAISDTDYASVDDFCLYYAADGSSYELAVIRLKDESGVKALEQALTAHVENRVKQYRYYDPEQVQRAENAVVTTRGRYAALIMCDDPAAVKAVFDSAFN